MNPPVWFLIYLIDLNLLPRKHTKEHEKYIVAKVNLIRVISVIRGGQYLCHENTRKNTKNTE